MGLLPRDFYDMSPREYSLMKMGYETRRKESMKQTRMIMFTMVTLFADPKSAPKSPEEFWPLPGEKDIKQINEEEYREIFKRLSNV
jgi:hypothetical protein